MLTVPLSVLAAHWLADWKLQSNNMAIGKSKSNGWLTIHVLIVGAFLLPWGWKFALANFWLHWLTDWVTSRINSKLWFIDLNKDYEYFPGWFDSVHVDPRKRHWFFVSIGFDQLLHFAAYAVTGSLLGIW